MRFDIFTLFPNILESPFTTFAIMRPASIGSPTITPLAAAAGW
jgi:hypothetical protein